MPIDHEEPPVDRELAKPEPGKNDLPVEICAVSVNPIDAKARLGHALADGKPCIPGFDAAGIVRKTGAAINKTEAFRRAGGPAHKYRAASHYPHQYRFVLLKDWHGPEVPE